MSITEQVFAAFQIEYKEHLEGIRTLLAQHEQNPSDENKEGINQAFRLAHSLKGGARVCDLRPIEELGHRLEAVFEQLRNGALGLNDDVIAVIKQVLDAIEDWMAARERFSNPAAPSDALEAVERLLQGCGETSGEALPLADRPAAAAQRLLTAFRSEFPRYLVGLRKYTDSSDDETATTTNDWNEAFRLAHNLRASADAAEIKSLESVCADLESLIAEFCDQQTAPSLETRERLQRLLVAIDEESKSFSKGPSAAASEGCEPASESQNIDSTPTMRPVDTVRISTAGLDGLLRSSRQLLTESLGQDQVGRELEDVRRQIGEMQREHESFRRAAASSLHRLEVMPEFNRVARYFENVDRDIRTLARRSRRICTAHKRSARMLHARARQIQQDVGQARMVPAETIYQGFRKMVRDLAREEGKQAEFSVTGFDVRADRMVFQALKDPLIHMLRNCIVHGIESPGHRRDSGKDPTGRIHLRIETTGNRLTVEVDDDGRGIDRERIYRQAVETGLLAKDDSDQHSFDELENLIYQPGFTTSERLTEVAGRGMGLSVVRDAVMRLQGDVQVVRKDSAGAKFRITVPVTVSMHRLLLVSQGEQTYAIPIHAIERLLHLKAGERETIEGKPVITFRDRTIPLVGLSDLLGSDSGGIHDSNEMLQVAVLKSGSRRIAVSVDAFLAEKDSLIQDLDGHAASNCYLGAILLENGHVALVLNFGELLQSYRPGAERATVDKPTARPPKRTPRVLVVDDSFTTRTLEKSILEANGYEVGIAVDGVEGLNQLQRERYDLVISDVEMPRMDGFGLLVAIKQDERLSSTPVVLVTSRDRREDQEKGLDLGADAYIVKQKFDHQSWLSAIQQIVDA